MREYKFRGKAKATGEWVYGDLLHHSHWKDGSYWIRYFDEEHQCFVSVKVDPDTVGQYTGLFDKNGNELWESDIIENKHKERYLIVWGSTGFNAALDGSKKAIYSANEYWFKSCKKIGNKWDNPELLKEVESV